MARYASLMGKRVLVHYRAGEITLPATARLVADSGRSIFLEEHYVLRGRVQTFRWEIPYSCVLRLEESVGAVAPAKEHDPETPMSADSAADVRMMPFRNPAEQT
jgi:hypothetical protein